ncbi:MAG: hypothetical protein K8L99_21150, partial [Anaerolineae bacterium]|nr:hypothetical protein [Anaerolineae bacterium]
PGHPTGDPPQVQCGGENPVMLEGLCYEDSTAGLCRREGVAFTVRKIFLVFQMFMVPLWSQQPGERERG